MEGLTTGVSWLERFSAPLFRFWLGGFYFSGRFGRNVPQEIWVRYGTDAPLPRLHAAPPRRASTPRPHAADRCHDGGGALSLPEVHWSRWQAIRKSSVCALCAFGYNSPEPAVNAPGTRGDARTTAGFRRNSARGTQFERRGNTLREDTRCT